MGLLAGIMITGCAHAPPPRPPAFDRPETRAQLELLEGHNAGLRTFRMTGRVSLQQAHGRIDGERFVAAGMAPGCLRLVVQSVTGMPAATLACDEAWYYLLLHAEGEFHKKPLGSGGLKRLLGIDIGCPELFALLVGRVPLKPYGAARRLEAGPGEPWGLELQTVAGRGVQRLFGDAATGSPVRYERLDGDGDLELLVRFGPMLPLGDYRRPAYVEIGSSAATARIEIRQMSADDPLPPDVFRIEAPP